MLTWKKRRRKAATFSRRPLLPVLGLKLLSKYEIAQLKRAGNTDPSKIFIAWDYLRDCPTGEPLKPAEHYQEIIRNKFYE